MRDGNQIHSKTADKLILLFAHSQVRGRHPAVCEPSDLHEQHAAGVLHSVQGQAAPAAGECLCVFVLECKHKQYNQCVGEQKSFSLCDFLGDKE